MVRTETSAGPSEESAGTRLFDLWVAVGIFALALLVRVVFLAQLDAYPRFELIRNRLDDQTVFVEWAHALLEGRDPDVANTGHEYAYWAAQNPGVYPQAPLYPWMLAASYGVAGREQHDAIRTLQALLGAASALFVFLIARRFVAIGPAAVAGCALALYGPLVFYSSVFLRPTLLTFLAALSIWLVSGPGELLRGRKGWQWFFAGLVLALGTLTRANLLFFATAVVVATWLVVRRVDRRQARNAVIWLGVGLSLPLFAVSARNTIKSGRPAFISSNAAFVLFLGNVHDASGTSAGSTAHYLEVKESHEAGGPGLGQAILEDIREHPGAWVRLQGRKLFAFFGPVEIPNNVSYGMGRKLNPALRWAPVEFHWILPVSVVGLVVGWRRRRELSVLYLFVLLFTVGTVAFFVLGRLRLPVIVGLLPFAAVALQWCWDAARRGHLVRSACAAVFIVMAPMVMDSRWNWHRDTDYQMAAAAHATLASRLSEAGDWDGTRRELGRTIALNPDHAEALEALEPLLRRKSSAEPDEVALELCNDALESYQSGNRTQAERLLDEAVDRSPELALPWQYRANIRVLEGEMDTALTASEKALELEPTNPLYRENVKRLRARIGTARAQGL